MFRISSSWRSSRTLVAASVAISSPSSRYHVPVLDEVAEERGARIELPGGHGEMTADARERARSDPRVLDDGDLAVRAGQLSRDLERRAEQAHEQQRRLHLRGVEAEHDRVGVRAACAVLRRADLHARARMLRVVEPQFYRVVDLDPDAAPVDDAGVRRDSEGVERLVNRP